MLSLEYLLYISVELLYRHTPDRFHCLRRVCQIFFDHVPVHIGLENRLKWPRPSPITVLQTLSLVKTQKRRPSRKERERRHPPNLHRPRSTLNNGQATRTHGTLLHHGTGHP